MGGCTKAAIAVATTTYGSKDERAFAKSPLAKLGILSDFIPSNEVPCCLSCLPNLPPWVGEALQVTMGREYLLESSRHTVSFIESSGKAFFMNLRCLCEAKDELLRVCIEIQIWLRLRSD